MTGRHWECLLQSSNICFCWLAQLRVRCCDLLLLALLRRLCSPLVVGGQGSHQGAERLLSLADPASRIQGCLAYAPDRTTVVVVKCAAAAPAVL